jgi:hypothetical protein
MEDKVRRVVDKGRELEWVLEPKRPVVDKPARGRRVVNKIIWTAFWIVCVVAGFAVFRWLFRWLYQY